VAKKPGSAPSRARAAPSRRPRPSSRAAPATRPSSLLARPLAALRDGLRSPDRKLDLLGLLLIAAGALTLISLLTPEGGVLSDAWLRLLRGGFGWGTFIVPLAMIAGGLWLVLRTFGDRLPRLTLGQTLGAVLLYLTLLGLFHALLRTLDWREALEAGLQGRGGGLIGALLWGGSRQLFGGAGTLVVLAALALGGLVVAGGLSLPQAARWAADLAGRARARLPQPRPPRPQPTSRPALTAGTPGPPGARPGAPAPPAAAADAGPGAAALEAEAETRLAQPAPRPPWDRPSLEAILEAGAVALADDEFDRERARVIEETLRSFGAPARVVETNRGPTITQFGVEPDYIEGRAGKRLRVKVGKISALADDLALALAAPSIRIEAPVPGKGFVGIEVPNPVIALVALRDVMESEAARRIRSGLRIGLGKDVSGRPVAADLSAMPHLLIAGTTGSGKSVCVNALIACLLLQNDPDELKFVMVDPKRVELTSYNGVPHLLAPVVVDLERVVPALQWVSREMDDRYQRFAREGARNLQDYNTRMQQLGRERLPYLVVVIDELADLMMLAPDETERVITRLAQLARATGIHLVIATQRPSVDVVTGLIKANFPARIAFAVASSVDSRVILDQPGAERLLGRGDMLFHSPEAPAPIRMQGAYVSEPELQRLIRHWREAALRRGEPAPQDRPPAAAIPAGAPLQQAVMWDELADAPEPGDALFDEAVEIVRGMRRASVSLLQRRLRIGYTRAARLVDELEERGIIGPAQSGSQAREVLDYGSLAPERSEE
jgi:DNA segregation ATPase FtsK/SpoIIIE, S-DNA-T family